MPVEEFFVKITTLPKINHKALTDHESIILKDFSIKLLCELEKLAVVVTIAAAKLPTLPHEARDILLCLVPFIKNKTDAELEMVCREVNISSRKEISQSQYDSPDTQLSQGTKSSEETHVNSTVSPVIENSETKALNDIGDTPVITTDTINQDGNIANEARPQLYSNTTLGQYLDFSSKSTHTNSRSDNTKRSNKNTSNAQKPQFTKLGMHTRKQRKSKLKSNKVKRAHKTIRTKMVKSQTKQNAHLITQLFAFGHTLTSNFNLFPHMLPFHHRFLHNKPRVKIKYK